MTVSAHARARTLGASCSIQGVQLQAGTQVFLGLANELVLCVLPAPQRIQEVPCAAGLVHFHPDAGLAQATLGRAHVERGVHFEAGTILSWNEDGTLGAVLADEAELEGRTLPAGATLRFDAGGLLASWSIRLEDAAAISGVPCAEGSIVTFHASGQLERATLGEGAQIGPWTALGGTEVEFHPDGTPSHLTLGAPATFGAFHLEAGTTLTLRTDGTLSVASLGEDLTVDGVPYPDGAQLYFDAAGALQHPPRAGRMTGQRARS